MFAADVQLGRAVNGVLCGRAPLKGLKGFQSLRLAFRFGVAAQAFPAALSSKAAFADAAKTGGGIHHIGAIDPDDA